MLLLLTARRLTQRTWPPAAHLLALPESGSAVQAAVALEEGLRGVGGARRGGRRGIGRVWVFLHLMETWRNSQSQFSSWVSASFNQFNFRLFNTFLIPLGTQFNTDFTAQRRRSKCLQPGIVYVFVLLFVQILFISTALLVWQQKYPACSWCYRASAVGK